MEIELGSYIRSVRKERNLTLKDVGKLANISFTQVGKIERGLHHPTRESVEKISEALNIDKKTLLNLAGYTETSSFKVNSAMFKQKRTSERFYFGVESDIRYSTLIRNNSTCQLCGAKAPGYEILVIHINPSKPYVENNLTTLCVQCHISRQKSIERNGLKNDHIIRKFSS